MEFNLRGEKMKTLDDAVIELNGVLPDVSNGCNGAGKFVVMKMPISRNDKSVGIFFDDEGDLLFTGSGKDFQQRAKELGFINGYRWGVEYKTDGKRPELPDDVGVNATGGMYCSFANNPAGGVFWDRTDKFIICDPRYKPADTSYLEKPASSASTGRVEVDMIAQAKHEFSTASRAFQDLFKESFDKVIDKMEKERKVKAERDRIISAAESVMLTSRISNTQRKTIARLYDKGFLKLPE